MSNVIKQIVRGSGDTQTIKMIVRDNERGPQGEQGEQGRAATVTAGNAYSVPANAEPAVINTGTENDAVLDFYIPRTAVQWGDVIGDINDQTDLKTYLDKADTAVQPSDINRTVLADLDVDTNYSTSVLQLDASQVNLMTGSTGTKDIPLPVASASQAGVMNSATFNAVAQNAAGINALLNGSVAIAGLPVSPTQSELTTAWQQETGLTDVVNRSQILDVDNDKLWMYYDNTGTWYETSISGTVSISTFTNSSEGTIRGSTSVGQVFAESDGTGSINGWDALDARVTNNTNALLRVGTVLSEPTSVAYVDTANIVDEAVTSDKIDFSTLGNQSSYLKFGDIVVCFGKVDVRFPAGGEVEGSITFPIEFDSNPTLVVSRSDSNNLVGEFVVYSMLSTTGFTYFAGQTISGPSTPGTISYVAIGTKTS